MSRSTVRRATATLSRFSCFQTLSAPLYLPDSLDVRAELEDFRTHDLRHTCAAWLVSNGVPLTEVRDLRGHSTVRMTERYTHLAPENVREAVKHLDSVSRFGHGREAEQQTA